MNDSVSDAPQSTPSGWQSARSAAHSAPQQLGVALCPQRRPLIAVNWRAYDFKRVRKGKTETVDLVITASGSRQLEGIQVQLTGAEYLIDNPGAFATSLAPGASTTVRIKFAPATLGKKTASVRVSSNASNENPIDVRLTGRPVAVIAFAVQDEKSGDGLEAVKLTVKQSGRKQKEITTGSDGTVELETEHAGPFRVVLGDHETLLEFHSLASA